MKKSKLKLGLVTSFICGMALTACDVVANDKFVVQYKDYSDSELGLLTDNMYANYLDTSAGLTKYYEKVRDLLVRATFEKVTANDAANGLKVKTPYATLKAQAQNKVDEQKETARKNAKNNDTSYSDELDAIYKSHDCEDEEGLYQHFLLDLEKEQLDSAIMDNDKQLEILRDGNGSDEKGWINSANPYHIKHMLVKVEGGADNFTRATISEDEATKLAKVVTLLASGSKFDDLAANNLLNDDSSDKLGDVGIVNNNATTKSLKMVSEFQLGIYTADKLINGAAYGADVDFKGIGMDADIDLGGDASVKVKDEIKIVEVPYAAFAKLAETAKYPEEDEDSRVKDINACVYPRNVLWNKYFNNHNVFVISNKKANETLTPANMSLVGTDVDATAPAGRFNANGYLTADDGKVIFGVRSEYGIHFIKIQKSAYDGDLKSYYPYALKEGSTDYTAAAIGSNYIVGLDNAKDTYESRLSDIKSAIKGYDSNSEYRLYNFLLKYAQDNNIIEKEDAKTNNVLDKINGHIKDLKDSESYKQTEGLKTVWENYLRFIALQNEKRAATWTEGYYYETYVSGAYKTVYKSDVARSALISEATADAYVNLCNKVDGSDKADLLAQFVIGGDYYYAK